MLQPAIHRGVNRWNGLIGNGRQWQGDAYTGNVSYWPANLVIRGFACILTSPALQSQDWADTNPDSLLLHAWCSFWRGLLHNGAEALRLLYLDNVEHDGFRSWVLLSHSLVQGQGEVHADHLWILQLHAQQQT